jgi:hypothetical protein
MVDKDDLAKLAPNRLGDRWHHENQGMTAPWLEVLESEG